MTLLLVKLVAFAKSQFRFDPSGPAILITPPERNTQVGLLAGAGILSFKVDVAVPDIMSKFEDRLANLSMDCKTKFNWLVTSAEAVSLFPILTAPINIPTAKPMTAVKIAV